MYKFYSKFVAVLLLLVASVVANAENSVTIAAQSVAPEQIKEVEIIVSLDEAAESQAFSADVYLPEGLSFVAKEVSWSKKDEYGFFNTEDVDIMGSKALKVQSNGALRIAAIGADFTKGEYAFVTFFVVADKNFKEGECQVKACKLCGVKQPDFTFKVVATTDAISSVASVPAEASAVYTLSGMQVSEPAKGIYIQDGKKFVK